MALTRTTASAVSVLDTEVTLANVAGLNAGDTLKVEDEYMRVTTVGATAAVPVKVYRGTNGTNVSAHAAGASAVYGAPFDPWGRNTDVGTRSRETVSYAASGAIDPPSPGRDRLVLLTGAAAQAMTLAAPPASSDGDQLVIASTVKVAHTVVTSAPIAGGATLATLTLDPAALCSISLMALGGFWVPFPSPVSGTLTSIDVGAT